MKNFLFLIITTLFILSSCDDSLEINDTYSVKPVIYSLLDRNSDVQYVKLNKTFLGDASVAEMASVSDSLYFDNADVYIKKYKDNSLVKSWKLVAVDTIPKDSGFFANDKNIIYVLNDKILDDNEDAEDFEFKFEAIIENQPEIKSSTKLVDDVTVTGILANSFYKQIPLHNYSGYLNPKFSFKANKDSRFFEVYLEVFYYEKQGDDYILKTISQKQFQKKVAETSAEQNTVDFQLNGEYFYSLTANNIDNKDSEKIIYGFRYLFYSAGEELSLYIDLTSDSYGIAQEKPAYTNIQNGWGLFSSRTSTFSMYKGLDNSSIQYFQEFDGTKDLNFLPFPETSTFYNQNPEYDFAHLYTSSTK